MKKMQKMQSKAFLGVGLFVFVVVVFFPHEAFAPPSRIVTHSSSGFLLSVLDVLLLLATVFCFFSSLKVKSFLKEGELSYGWVLFSIAFAILFMAQLLSFSVSSNLFHIPLSIVSLIRLLSILSLSIGIHSMKKILS